MLSGVKPCPVSQPCRLTARLRLALVVAIGLTLAATGSQATPVRERAPLSSSSYHQTLLRSLEGQESRSCVPETRIRGFDFPGAPQHRPNWRLNEDLYRVFAYWYGGKASGVSELSRDPIGFAGGWNLYAYVGSNPASYRDPLGLRIYPSDFMGPLGPGDIRMPVHPGGVDVDANMAEAAKHWSPVWFYNQVKNKGPWDYKQRGSQYQDFGNFNFGACGKAHGFGFADRTLLREAGRAQQAAGTSKPGWGEPGWRLNPWGGSGSYGDDPNDRNWIRRGIEYYHQTHPGTT